MAGYRANIARSQKELVDRARLGRRVNAFTARSKLVHARTLRRSRLLYRFSLGNNELTDDAVENQTAFAESTF